MALNAAFARLRDELSECVVGQPLLVERLLIALLADGHLLVEGAPGLAKTTAIKELAARIEADFHRSPSLGFDPKTEVGLIRCLAHGYPTPLARWHCGG